MISDIAGMSPRFREARSWGYEVRYGPSSLEETISQKDGSKLIPMMELPANIGSFVTYAEKRFNAGIAIRLTVRAWASEPIVSKKPLRERAVRLNKVLRRLIEKKAKAFFKERCHVPA